MKEFFITWATTHWLLAFFLAWFSLQCVLKFLEIFHRSPRVVNQEQLDQIRNEVLSSIERRSKETPPTTSDVPTTPPTQRGKTWHERLL